MKLIEEYLDHFPQVYSTEIIRYATNKALLYSRYIFTKRIGRQQYGYCTHCNQKFPTDGLRHNEETKCPVCSSKCIVKASGRGRGQMIDEAYFTFYEKSVIDPQVIIARRIQVVRDYRDDYTDVKTKFKDRSLYVFRMGESVMLKRWVYYSSNNRSFACGGFKIAASVHSALPKNDHLRYRHPSTCSFKSIEAAVAGTPFRYSTWETYTYTNLDDLVKFFAFYSKYPCVEYFTKLGLENLILEKLEGRPTYGAINWRGKDLPKILRLSVQEFKEISRQRIPISFFFLKILNDSKQLKWGFTVSDAYSVSRLGGGYYYDQLKKVSSKYAPVRTIVRYLAKQFDSYQQHFFSESSTIITWRDYLEDCEKLGMDITDEHILFPKNVHEAHQQTTRRLKLKANKKLDMVIKKLAKSIHQYFAFEYRGLMVRPAGSYEELLDEGNTLSHCVANYAERYAKGETVILLIRKTSEPETPYFTMEVKDNKIIQVHGLRNCKPDKTVEAFVKAFETRKLRTKKSKVKIPA